MAILLLLSLLAADPTAMMKVAADRAAAVCADAACRDGPRRSPYRLEPNVADAADGKAVALATTGQQCNLTGPNRCIRKPRTLYSASY